MTTVTERMASSDLRDMGDMKLLQYLESSQVGLKHYQDLTGHIEQEIFLRMEDRGATSIPNADANGEKVYQCERKDTYGYSPDGFTPLKELFNSGDLTECFTPEHSETITIEAKWASAGTIKKIAGQYGAKALEIVERARFLKGTSLKFERVSRD